MFATLRKNRTRPPLADTSNASATLAPLKARMSLPAWPSMMSLPSPGSQVKRSSPAPMSAVSLPWLPSSASLLSPPSWTSSPRPPSSVSSPAPPSSVSFMVSAPRVLASTRSSPPRALIVRASRATSACAVTLTVAASPVTDAAFAGAGRRDRVLRVGRVDDRLVVARVGRRAAEAAASSWLTVRTWSREVVDGDHVVAAERVDVDALDAVEVHRDGADVAGQPRARAVGRHGKARSRRCR